METRRVTIAAQGVPNESRARLRPPSTALISPATISRPGENLITCNPFCVSFSSLNILVTEPSLKSVVEDNGAARSYLLRYSQEFTSPTSSSRTNLLAKQRQSVGETPIREFALAGKRRQKPDRKRKHPVQSAGAFDEVTSGALTCASLSSALVATDVDRCLSIIMLARKLANFPLSRKKSSREHETREAVQR